MNIRRNLFRTIFALFFLVGSNHVHATEIIAYFPEWGVYQQPYYVKHIVESGSASHLTVLNYSFVVPEPDPVTGDIVCQFDDAVAAYQQIYNPGMSVDGVEDDPTDPTQNLFGHFNQLRKLKTVNPELKILIAIGGWLGSTWFSDAASTPASRAAFVASCIDLFTTGNLPVAGGAGGPGSAAGIFDGFDIDWEYPITGGAAGTHHNSNDDVNLTALLLEFRTQLNAIGPDFLLTTATPGNAFRGDNYQINSDQAHVDWFNIMTYDFHGGWDNKTGHHTNLLTSVNDPSSDAFKLSMDNAVRLYRDTYGVPVSKLVVGAAFYGRGWRNVGGTDNGLYQNGQEAPGVYEDGYNYFSDLIPLLSSGYNLYWDELALAPWLYSPAENIFWTLDDPQSIALKRRYIDAYSLRGGMFWEISGDDSSGSLVKALVSGNPEEASASLTAVEGPGMDISISKPLDCAISLEGFNVGINAVSIESDISRVEFFLNDDSLGFDNRPPWSWAGFNLPAGVHELTAVATDNGGNYNASPPVRLHVFDNAALALWQTGFSYQVGDRVFYDGCIYEAKRNHVGSRVRLPTGNRYWSLVTCSDCGDGGGGGSGGNEPPSVSFDSPSEDAEFNEGDDVDFVALASDEDGTVTKVEFNHGGTLLGEDASPPYELTWNSVPPGNHTINAIAYDNDGATGSASKTIRVSSPGGCTVSPWDGSITYEKGDRVQHNGILWQSKRTNSGIEPGTSPSKWTNLGPCTS